MIVATWNLDQLTPKPARSAWQQGHIDRIKADLAAGSSVYTIAMDVTNFGAERMVMGHTVQRNGINPACAEKRR